MHIEATERAQEVIRAWLRRVLEAKNWPPSRLAKEANISPATVSRALNDDQFTTSTTTIEKIVKATGIPAPSGIGLSANSISSSFNEPEAVYLSEPGAIGEFSEPVGDVTVWRLQSHGIELFGYMPGDLLFVDPAAEPRAGDAVCVQISNGRNADPEIVFRIYDPPYVMTRTMHREAEKKPLLVDKDRVQIWGVVIRSVRVRNA